MLSFSFITEPMIVPIIRDEEDVKDIYTDDFFWLHEKGVDLLFIYPYSHQFRLISVYEWLKTLVKFNKKYTYAKERIVSVPILMTLTDKMQCNYHWYIFFALVFLWSVSKIKTNSAFDIIYTHHVDEKHSETIKNLSCDEYNLKKPIYKTTYLNIFKKYFIQRRGWLIIIINLCLCTLARIFILLLIYWKLFVCTYPPLSCPAYIIIIITILHLIAKFIQNIDDSDLDVFLFSVPFAVVFCMILLPPLYNAHIWSPWLGTGLKWIDYIDVTQINIYITIYAICFAYLTFFCRYWAYALKKNWSLSDNEIYNSIFYSIKLPRITIILLLFISIVSLVDFLFFFEYINYKIFIDSDTLNTFSNYNNLRRYSYYRVGYLTPMRYQLLAITFIFIFILAYFRRFKNGYKTYYEILKNDYISLYDSTGAMVACYYMIERSYLIYGNGAVYNINMVEAGCCLCVPVCLYVHVLYSLIFLEKFFKNNSVIMISIYNLFFIKMFSFFKKYHLLVNPEYNWKIINSFSCLFYNQNGGRKNFCWLTGKKTRDRRHYWEYHTIVIWYYMLLSIFNLKCFIYVVFNNEHTPLLHLLDEAIWLLLFDMYAFTYTYAFPLFILDKYFLNQFTLNLINALLKYIEIIILKKTWESNSTAWYFGNRMPLIFLSKHYIGIITLLFLFIIIIAQTYLNADFQLFFEWAGITVNSKYVIAFYEFINWIINF